MQLSADRAIFPSWLLWFLVLSICGCTTLPRTTPISEEAAALWSERQARLHRLVEWQLKAKVGVRTSHRGGSATLRWQHEPTTQQIELSGPLGGGRIRISSTASGATLEDTTGETLQGKDPGDLLYRRLGWGIPFGVLSSWIRGLPGEEATVHEIDEQGLLRRVSAAGWELEILDYREQSAELLPRSMRIRALPGTLQIYSDTGEYLGDELQVKLIVKSWQNLSTPTSGY